MNLFNFIGIIILVIAYVVPGQQIPVVPTTSSKFNKEVPTNTRTSFATGVSLSQVPQDSEKLNKSNSVRHQTSKAGIVSSVLSDHSTTAIEHGSGSTKSKRQGMNIYVDLYNIQNTYTFNM